MTLVLFVLQGSALAQDSTMVASMLEAYQRLDYEKAEIYAEEVLASYDAYSQRELTRVHTTLGIIKFAQNKQSEAREQFSSALSIDPGLELDPTLVSPKILSFFDALKADLGSDNSTTDGSTTVRYLLIEDLRPAASVRSMVLPGLGQRYKGERKKGNLFMGLWGISAGSALALHFSRQSARRAYRQARAPEDIADKYKRYNTLHKFRNGAALTAAGVWIYSYLDALSRPAAVNDRGDISFQVVPDHAYPYTRFVLSKRL